MFIKWRSMQPVEVYVDDESKLTLHGLVQHYTMLTEDQKNKRLMDLLDQLDFNQVPFCSTELHCMSILCCLREFCIPLHEAYVQAF